MVTLIIFALIVLAGYLFRKSLTNFLITLFKRKQKTIEHTNEITSIFQPAGTVRTFFIGLDIEEDGNGSVKITLAKKIKNND